MTKQISVISNFCVEPFWEICINEQLYELFMDSHTAFVPYAEVQNRAKEINNADLVVVLLNFELLYPNLAIDLSSERNTSKKVVRDCLHKCKELYTYIKENNPNNIIWFGFEDYYNIQHVYLGNVPAFGAIIDRINLSIEKMIGADSFIDFKRLISTVGTANAYDTKGKYRWNAPYSKELIHAIISTVQKQHAIVEGLSKKCLILDCDNVLWGGVLSECGIEGIHLSESGLGRPFRDFQRMVLDMHYHGVILAICSKNDECDILKVFRSHTGMLIKEDHIACFRCNWNNKPDNIKEIVERLNIALGSVVFIDDSLFEIKAVQAMLPEVKTILFDAKKPCVELDCFNLQQSVSRYTSRQRTETYRLNEKRILLREAASSYEDYLLSLEMEIDIHKTVYHELGRIAELTQRTNKCTNGKRYTLEMLKRTFEQSDYVLYTVCLKDRFSDLGIVGAIGITDRKIDLFSLSCRALGREIEKKMILFAKAQGATTIDFIRSFNNQNLQEMLVMHKLLNENVV